MFRLKPAPPLSFQKLTGSFNRTMFRLNRRENSGEIAKKETQEQNECDKPAKQGCSRRAGGPKAPSPRAALLYFSFLQRIIGADSIPRIHAIKAVCYEPSLYDWRQRGISDY